MKRILFVILLLCSVFQGVMYGQSCIDVVFPNCPGQDGVNKVPPTNFKTSMPCDTTIIQPQYGTVTIDPANANIDGTYYYNPFTNCSLVDTFTVIECCDTLGQTVCDTLEQYYLHLTFECETPDDLFCCIAPGTFPSLDVLVNDSTFIQENYDVNTDTIVVDSVTVFPVNGALEGVQDNPFNYSPFTGFTGLDSFSYQVTYAIITNAGDTIIICDEQTCYILVEDCLNTMEDEFCIAPGDTLCIDPLANDIVEVTLNDPILNSMECQNPLPVIDTKSLIIAPQSPAPLLFTNDTCDYLFSYPTTGTYTYLYQVCTDVDGCAIDTIRVTVDSAACSGCSAGTDYQALRALYLSTEGDNWTDNTGWPSEALFNAYPTSPPPGYADLGAWTRVTTNGDGCVTHLLLGGNNLHGTLPPEIGDLAALIVLSIPLNSIGGTIPSEIGNLSNLQVFSAYSCYFIGSIPTTIGNLSQLTELRLNGNNLTGIIPPTLGNLSNLRILALSANDLSGTIPPQLGNLTNLEQLSLQHNELTGSIPAGLGNLSALEFFNVSSNDLSGCYDPALSALCMQLNPVSSTNSYISTGNAFDATWEDFCNLGQGACITTCAPVIDMGTTTITANTIHAQNEVISAGTIPANANVSLKAGQTIELQQGFNSDANANLEILIEDCIPE